MKYVLATLLLPLMPAQFGPDEPPTGGSICDRAQTRCIIRFEDWGRWDDDQRELRALRQQVKTTKCASLTVTEPRR